MQKRPFVAKQTAAYLKGEVYSNVSVQTVAAYIKKTIGLVFVPVARDHMLNPVNLYSNFYQH